MLVFWKARLVILAVPKTGTTALEHALAPLADAAILNPPQLKHCPVRRYRRVLRDFFENDGQRKLEVMAVMREPVSWLGSWYRYRARPQIADTPRSTAGMSFDAFVEAWLDTPAPEPARVGRQSRFLTGGDGTLGVDHLFRYDRMDQTVSFLQDRLGQEITLPVANVSSAAHDLTLDTDITARLHCEAKPDFNIWNQLVESQP